MDTFAKYESQDSSAEGDAERLSALNMEAEAVARTGDIDRALEIVARVETMARSLGDTHELGRAGCVRATCDYLRADYLSAHKASLESGAAAERSDDHMGLAAALLIAAACQYQMGALEEAHMALLQVLDIAAETPDDEIAFRAHNMLGMILTVKNDHAGATRQFELAAAAGTKMKNEFFLQRVTVNRASLSKNIGDALRGAGREAEAVACFQKDIPACEGVLADALRANSRENAAGCAGVLGELYMRLSRSPEAIALLEEMRGHGEAMKNALVQAEAQLLLGRHHAESGEPQLAKDYLERSLTLATQANARRLVVDVHASLAHWYELQGDSDEALRRYKHFHALSEEVLRAELETASRVRTLWRDFQRAQNDAFVYRERFKALARDNELLATRTKGLARDALEDPLTGLANRRSLDVRLTELANTTFAKDAQVALAMMDVDHFKEINDRFSHVVGDEVLRSIAAMIRSHCREVDVSARFGGDEFVICFIGTALEAAVAILERLRGHVETHDWAFAQPGLGVTVSVGVTILRSGEDMTGLLARADLAMYRAKNSGRNRVCYE